MRIAGTLALAFALGVGLAAPVRADSISDAQRQISTDEAEVAQLEKNLDKPRLAQKPEEDLARRLVDAEVAFALGRYDDAALLLYDYVGQASKPRDYDVALYYLAESLYQKGDRVAARTYFAQLARENASSKFQAQALIRLVELAILLRDASTAAEWLSALDRHSSGPHRDAVAYVKGKYAAWQDQHDEAIGHFTRVSAGSTYEFQAQYYTAVENIAKKDLGKATDTLDALLKKAPRRDADRRVLELTQLALGRLYYERDQPSKSIDSYLMVDRRSDLFPDALYEVAWVYVKGKQFDKALRALELLALTDPLSSKTPTVKILEGNLRIRKAQMLKARIDMGGKVEGAPAEEYTKADGIFTQTHDTYVVPHDELGKIIDAKTDPEQYVSQVSGRPSKTFETNAVMPEIAAAWLREEPDVARVVAIESDLGEIQSLIDETTKSIERVELAMSSPANRVGMFPKLAEKRHRGTEIEERLTKLQIAMLDEMNKGGGSAATQRRQQVAAELAALPSAELEYRERIARARAEYDKVDQRASEVQVAIESTDATIAALRKYMKDAGNKLTKKQRDKITKEIAALEPEVKAMRTELDDLRNQIVQGRDTAGIGDEVALKDRELRKQLREAINAEARGAGGDPSRLGVIQKAGAVVERIAKMNEQIDGMVDAALGDVRTQLAKEKNELNSYRKEFLSAEAESRALGGTVLGQSFKQVKAKFYDVVIRSDVGLVDVSWSQKEDVDSDLAKLNTMQQREVKQLRDEFRDLLEEDKLKQQTGAKKAPPLPPPRTEPIAPEPKDVSPTEPKPKTPPAKKPATKKTGGKK